MKKQIAAILMTLVLVLSVCGAAFCMVGHTRHDCDGACCRVCAVLEQCEGLLRAAGTAAAVILLLTVFRRVAAMLRVFAVRETAAATPIQLKVKLLN